ncbi:spore coat protein U domain-containing protein [Niveispirillum sp. SYP-B3756]|uniref:spore coat protein U domain-containing protein n=1 Tax=Niveispirillum sp. SYP-B3756 TaxID=2662178 RepID=UPI0032B4AF94
MFKTFARAFALTVVTAAAFAAPALAQNANGTIQLRGNVALSCTIAVTDLSQSLSLKTGENAKTVGNVTETCNSGNGYKITLASTNAGKLKSGNNEIAYQVNYDNQAGALTTQMIVDRASAQFNKKSDLKVTVPASTTYIAGDYSDSITVTIAAK